MKKLPVHRPCPLKDFLSQSLHISGAQAKRLLDQKKVFVNKQRVWIAGYQLTAGAVVEIQADTGRALSPYTIAAEDNEYLLVNKPAGLLVNAHPASLETQLRKELKNPRLCAAHRLDRDTSGLVIFAKNNAAFQAIVEVFKNFGIEKYYRGIAQGDCSSQFPANFKLTRQINGQPAETRLRLLRTNKLASYFEARLITGRRHQIRIHLSQAGFPLLGEKTYQTKTVDNLLCRRAPRQMLHASAVSFTNPCSGRRLSAQAKEPADFQNTLRLLEL
jgi:RluA family pseudouridine synthase